MAKVFPRTLPKNKNQPTITSTEKLLILQVLSLTKSLCRRQIHNLTLISVSSLCRALKGLEDKGLIKIESFRKDCVTGRSVYFYALNKKGVDDEQ
ncbi:hypothetical protein ACFOWA_13185 [Pedobacter lithocola]|uniref:MarR family transcriptional regulator n=1 Tax=Pedobacter lithocola TaxID=1908239 RepID=A0ABV8PDQ7_9SPHI